MQAAADGGAFGEAILRFTIKTEEGKEEQQRPWQEAGEERNKVVPNGFLVAEIVRDGGFAEVEEAAEVFGQDDVEKRVAALAPRRDVPEQGQEGGTDADVKQGFEDLQGAVTAEQDEVGAEDEERQDDAHGTFGEHGTAEQKRDDDGQSLER